MAPAQTAASIAIDVAGTPMEVTLKDGEAIRAALLQRLEQSDLGDRGELILATRGAHVWIDNGHLRIGTWILQARSSKLTLIYRGPFGRHAAFLCTAVVAKDGDNWSVKEVQAGEVLLRR